MKLLTTGLVAATALALSCGTPSQTTTTSNTSTGTDANSGTRSSTSTNTGTGTNTSTGTTGTNSGTGSNTGTDSSRSTSTSTSSNAAYSVPANLQTSFSTQYPNATNTTWSSYNASTVPIDWELNGWSAMDSTGHLATFTMDNQQYLAWYNADGTWVGSTYSISDYAKLPAAISTMIKNKYTGYNIDKVQREMWKDRMAYEVKLKKDDGKIKLLVDDQGNIIKEKLKD